MKRHEKALLAASICSLAAGFVAASAATALSVVGTRTRRVADTRMPIAPPPPAASQLGTGPSGIAGRLAGFIAIPTVIHDLPETGTGPFREAQRYLEQHYPRVHTYLKRTIVDEVSIEFHWHAAPNPLLEEPTAPIVFMMHLDVMSAMSAGWTYPPFSGAIANGTVYGRGSFASKGPLICLLDAIEQLLAEDWVPSQDIYILVSGDAEGNCQSSRALVASLLDEGIRPSIVLDVGTAITPFPFPALFRARLAAIGLAQQGIASYRMTATTAGGATAAPPLQSDHAIAVLERQLRRVFPAAKFHHVDANSRAMFRIMWQHAQGAAKLPLKMIALFPNVAARIFSLLHHDMAALFNTSLIPTNVHSGHGEQVVPTFAVADIQAHLALGDSIPKLTERMRRAITDPRVTLELVEQRDGINFNVASPQYQMLVDTVNSVFENVVATPFTTYYFTDSRFFADAADTIYCFAPLMISQAQRAAVHSTNESVDIAALHKAVSFYRRWIQTAAGPSSHTGSSSRT